MTVAGRDGEERLGQESEELTITLQGTFRYSFLITPTIFNHIFPGVLSKNSANLVTLYTESRLSTTFSSLLLTSTYCNCPLPSPSG